MHEIEKGQLEKIESLIRTGYYNLCIMDMGALFETILKKIYKQAIVELPFKDRESILKIEADMGEEGYNRFGFGKLVGLFNRCNLLELWSQHSKKELGLLKSISLNSIVDLRNKITHHSANNAATKYEAEFVYQCLKNWLAFIGYSELESGISESFKPEAEKTAGGSNTAFFREALNHKWQSTYSVDSMHEKRRLATQTRIYENIALKGFETALSMLNKRENLIGVDLGCADGTVTKNRFGKFPFFKKVIGIDRNKELFPENDDIFKFHCLDLESADFEEQLSEILHNEGCDGIDVVFSALVIHHLKDPLKVLRRVRKVMNDDSAIILQGSDDGSKMSYGDDGLMDEIISETYKIQGSSDRLNGRKLYTQLYDSGYAKIRVLYEMADTVGKNIEERFELFSQSFSFRKDYYKRLLDKDPENIKLKKQYENMREKIDSFEEVFAKPNFYYCEILPVAVATKK